MHTFCIDSPEKTPIFSLNVNSSVITIGVHTDNMSFNNPYHKCTYKQIHYWYTGHTDRCAKKIDAGSDSLIPGTLCPWPSLSLVFQSDNFLHLYHHCSPMSRPLGPCPQHPEGTHSIWVQWAGVCCWLTSHQSHEEEPLRASVFSQALLHFLPPGLLWGLERMITWQIFSKC